LSVIFTTRKPSARPYWVSLRERARTKSALLETARVIVARDGEDALTLGSLADEAGLARATVYGFFSGKRDLLAALAEVPEAAVTSCDEAQPMAPEAAAEDAAQPEEHQPELTGFASATSLSEAVKEEAPTALETSGTDSEESALSATAIEADETSSPPSLSEETAETPDNVAVLEAAQEAPDATADASEQPVPEEQPTSSEPREEDDHTLLTSHEQDRRLQAVHLEEIAKRLILPESALKEGTDAVISRLETRLRVLERSIVNLETRQSTIPEEATKKIKPVSDLVTQLQSRTDVIEDRQRQALAELRLSIHELAAKQGQLAVVNGAPAAELPDWSDVKFEPGPVKAETVAEAESAEKSAEDENAEKAQRDTYLAAARNLAKEGARQAAERESVEDEELRSRKRRLLAAAAVAAVCLVAVGALYELHPGSHGVSVAQSKAIAPAVAAKPHHALAAPLDRLTLLANKGNAKAQMIVGLKYLKGDGVAANDTQAAYWFMRAAKGEDPIAENLLGSLFQAGHGVPADTVQAMHWYEAAAQQGNRHAMSNLAGLYAAGKDGERNLAEAARWFEQSANLGYVDAQFNLAVLFERGDGVPQSLLDAYKWYSIAASSGDPVAKTRADAISTQVSPDELQAAQQAVANFKPQPLNRAANDVPSMAEVLSTSL